MSNPAPQGWKLTTLEKNARLITDGAHLSPATSNDGKPIATVQNMRSETIDISSCRLISANDFDALVKGNCSPEAGDVLFSKDGTVGKTFVYDQPDKIVLLSSIAIIRLDPQQLDPVFCSQFLLSPLFYNTLENTKSGSAIRRIVLSDLKKLELPKPPLPEQQKIATILSSVDDVIEKTCAQIDKLKDLKTGMMQELLTKGIGHTEFKDSPVGRIPSAWTAKLLDSVAKRGSGHTPSKTEDSYWNGGVKWISLSDSSQLDNLYIHKTKKEISELGLANSSAVLHPAGIVVMARDAGIGKSAITTSPMAVSQHFMAWLCGDRLDNYFLYYLLQYRKPQFENIAMGSTIKTIGLPYFRTMMIPVPPLDEQVKISSSLKAVDETLFRLNEKSDAAHKLKKALMQDLLTGKVRVKLTELDAKAAS